MTIPGSRFAFLLLCIQVFVTQAAADESTLKWAKDKLVSKLAGGFPADEDVFAAYTVFANSECGGVLITKNMVLTAASCVQSGHPDTVRIGAFNRTGGTEVGVRCAKSHPLYVWPGFQYDIAVLKLEEDVTTVKTPTLNADLSYPGQVGQDLILAGMGRNSTSGFVSDKLEQIRYQFVSEDECKFLYGDKITRGLHICAYGLGEGGKPAISFLISFDK